jgi:hypothetical protein
MTVLAAFTPDAVAVSLLDRITVGRSAELGVLEDAFRAAATSQARPNVLVVGPRGSGKTHLLAVAEHRLRSDPFLAQALVTVRLPEDAYAVTSYGDLLAATIAQLGAPPDGDLDDFALEAALLEAIEGRVLVWMVENFDRLLRVLGVEGQRQLRALLHNHGPAVLVASTPALFSAVSRHDAPLYGAFRVVNLGDLSAEDGRQLLVQVARLRDDGRALVTFLRSDRGLRRLRAVADLAGGLPRLWHLLAASMTVELLDQLVPLVVRIVDQLTPYYKARVDGLSAAKAKLVAHLCRPPGGARTVTELAAATAMTNQAASKLLGELERDRVVRSMKVRGSDQRTTFYEVREPLLRHCLVLKERGVESLANAVRALREWHDGRPVAPVTVDDEVALVRLPPEERVMARVAARDRPA